MKLITQRQLIQMVAARWRQQYEPFKNETPSFSVRKGLAEQRTKRQIAEELDALNGDTATPAEVVAIIGNNSWTRLECDECKNDEVDAVLRVGAKPDYESSPARLCKQCVEKAAATNWQ